MNNKKSTISIFVVVFILFSALSFFAYDKSESVDIVCFEGSFAHEYAEKHNINYELISDSDAYIADLSLENFDYNYSNGVGEIVAYSGDSEKIAIPADIDGNTITKIRANAFKDAGKLKTIYIPKTVTEFEVGSLSFVTVYLYEDSPLYDKLSNDKDLKIEIKTIPDSYYVNFYSANIPFSYNNISNNEIEINRYNAEEKFICIPESIDGKTVSVFSIDALNNGIEKIVIPESVVEIKSGLYVGRYDTAFVVALLLALIITIISIILIAITKVDTNNKKFLSLSQVGAIHASYYVALIIDAIYLFVKPSSVLIFIFIAVYGIGLGVYFASKSAAGEVLRLDNKVKEQTLFIKSLTSDADSLVSQVKNTEIKSEIIKVYEAIRYSDPMSNDSLSGLESQITLRFNDLKKAVVNDDAESVKTITDELLILIKDRNNKCKLLK